MPHQIKGKSLSLVPKIIALDIEIIKIVHNKSGQESTDEPEKQHFQVVIANPPEKQTIKSGWNPTEYNTGIDQ